MQAYVGTSGWMYTWNPDGFDWYINYSQLNSVELNSSFYRFPYPNQIRSWARKTSLKSIFRWSVKIHRSISHYKLLTLESIYTWNRFKKLFSHLDPYIDFYLLQLPPRFKKNARNIDKIRTFIENTDLKERLAIEFRDLSWFDEEGVKIAEENGFTFVSVDSPMTSFIVSTHDIIYLRMHGRTDWYIHYYTDDELMEIISKILDLKPERVYVYFNNNHDMLENARNMRKLFGTYSLL